MYVREWRTLMLVRGFAIFVVCSFATACLPPQDYRITDEELAKRRDFDFRKTLVMSIDPATAKDLDDALSIESLDNGNWRVGVHIADVTVSEYARRLASVCCCC